VAIAESINGGKPAIKARNDRQWQYNVINVFNTINGNGQYWPLSAVCGGINDLCGNMACAIKQ